MEREVEQDSNIHHQLTYSTTETGGDPQQKQLMEREVEQDSNIHHQLTYSTTEIRRQQYTPPTDLQHYRDTWRSTTETTDGERSRARQTAIYTTN